MAQTVCSTFPLYAMTMLAKLFLCVRLVSEAIYNEPPWQLQYYARAGYGWGGMRFQEWAI